MKDVQRPGEGSEDGKRWLTEAISQASTRALCAMTPGSVRVTLRALRAALLISDPGSLFDALVRVVRHHLAECEVEGDRLARDNAKLVNRSGVVRTG